MDLFFLVTGITIGLSKHFFITSKEGKIILIPKFYDFKAMDKFLHVLKSIFYSLLPNNILEAYYIEIYCYLFYFFLLFFFSPFNPFNPLVKKSENDQLFEQILFEVMDLLIDMKKKMTRQDKDMRKRDEESEEDYEEDYEDDSQIRNKIFLLLKHITSLEKKIKYLLKKLKKLKKIKFDAQQIKEEIEKLEDQIDELENQIEKLEDQKTRWCRILDKTFKIFCKKRYKLKIIFYIKKIIKTIKKYI